MCPPLQPLSTSSQSKTLINSGLLIVMWKRTIFPPQQVLPFFLNSLVGYNSLPVNWNGSIFFDPKLHSQFFRRPRAVWLPSLYLLWKTSLWRRAEQLLACPVRVLFPCFHVQSQLHGMPIFFPHVTNYLHWPQAFW